MQLHWGLVSEQCYSEQSPEEEYILEGESTGFDDGLSVESEGKDVSKITPRILACLLGAWRCFRGEWDKIWGKIGFSLTYFSDTRETSKRQLEYVDLMFKRNAWTTDTKLRVTNITMIF